MYKVKLDAARRIIAVYTDEMHGGAIPAGALEISDEVYRAWLTDQTQVLSADAQSMEPAPVAPPTLAQLLAHAAQRRWEIETGGLDVAGQLIRTDEQSQAKIAGACVLLSNDPDVTGIDWEAQPGTWVTLDRVTMTGIGVAVGRHVQRCFSALRQIQAQIKAEPPEITTTGAVDAAFAAALAP
ncbi:MAG: DUF4376 domain-containing protein [Pseudomonadota bacterium]